MPLHLDTPLLRSRKLSLLSGRDVWLKLDALQPSGSFKLRGIGAACEEYKRQGNTGFVSSSGGNAGLAVAYAGRMLGVPVTVVVPESTPLHARGLLEEEGATVIVHGKVWAEANELAQSLLDEATAFLHPFDNPLMWTGHATMIDEVVRAGVEFDGVILSVGGGGLLSGVAEGLDRNGLSHLPIVAVETQGADCLARALAAGENISIPAITSVATSLGANRVADHAFALAQSRNLRSVTVTDAEALEACELFLHDHRVLVEPACGASLAIAYSERHRSALDGIGAPLVIVCGGATATLEKVREWRAAA
ncbi:pyridoxal-phosphate dependent enzyme [uncultured Paracoccus sp.]|uniref:pyridoxal-phosphate dependent enzyme n=1 Tax=uncultured Paracoccus sp. TaxID=189685 RepID=UPI0026321573|nr:pyridoxal-phosphate dependent enzyme [uncultured Paracoccus sp.]HMR36798.1 pyridoxal-phosphate dependent enzyme [Paracoccus sp. (in: a-proteobacteria)]